MLAAMDFDGDIESAHSFLDTGGDFLHVLKIKDYSLYQLDWEYPKKEVLEIFRTAGIYIQETTLKYCMASGQAALNTEIALADTAGTPYVKRSPLLDDVLETYYLGGLEEITSSIIRCLPNLNSWFTNGVSKDPWSLCGAIIPESVSFSSNIIKTEGTFLTPMISLSNFGSSLTFGEKLLNNAPAFAVGAPNEEGSGSVYVMALSEFEQGISTIENFKLLPNIPRKPFETAHRFGSGVYKYSLLGQDFLLVTEPGTSTIHLFSGNTKLLTISDFTSSSSYGSRGRKQEGVSIETYDFDGDNIPDIIISSPHSDDGAPQRGFIQILSGKRLSLFLLEGRLGSIIDMDELIYNKLYLPKLYKLKSGYEQFGTKVAVSRDLIFTSASGLGIVLLFDHDGVFKHSIFLDKIDGLPIKRKTSEESHRFGSNFIKVVEYEGQEYLIVGAHAYSEGTCISCGAVYAYKIQGSNIKFINKVTLDISSKHSFAKFGYNMVIQDEDLYISAPRYLAYGAIFKIEFTKLFNPDHARTILKDIAFGNEGGDYIGYGHSLTSTYGKLIVGAPYYNYQRSISDPAKLIGGVIVYEI
ncbi:hypothetical protein BN7_2632 [Wickerhamomyces ciferrii]|uniref:Uncharacterized protein n=1 Tax=Wickerhamomyces ciferrii (strain ATCC 14091 / BCRC 22168 / CBS 111 / JCM 3599 / NBRC 0793 / NRRL Y-1031 F-60-10) TaxID=1206466 RepID=K0KDA4_WICCF|nr:uncharacterized protein BN7_2632 [Wickerhamomyces ciferrii]CCH43085.1 hypothetical protein BN7_2632 [Wickerhamomyces ciferrii]